MSRDKPSDSIAIHAETVSKDFEAGAELVRVPDNVTLVGATRQRVDATQEVWIEGVS